MKKIAFLIIIVFAFTTAKSQNHKGDSEYDLKNYKADPRDRLIIEINRTGWLNLPPGIEMSWKSMGVNVALMFDKPLGRSNFSIGYGLGLFSHNFHSNADFIYQLDSLNKNPTTLLKPKQNEFKINRYGQKILEIPLEIRFRTKTATMFKIMFGGKIGYVVSDFRKIQDADGKVKIFDIKNINPIQYGINFRIGFEQFCLTATYYLSEIFHKGKGPARITPYSIGLAIIPY